MFTGIIEEVGSIKRVSSRGANKVLEISTSLDVSPGDSISINGACLTVTENGDGWVKVEATAESLNRISLGSLYSGSRVNLERALTLSKPLGGHIVQGHVDSSGKISNLRKTEDAWKIEVAFSKDFEDLVVDQGSISIDGVSLTVLKKIEGPKFVVNVIPETLKRTTLYERRVGDNVNLEFDIIAKYIREQTRNTRNTHNTRNP